MCARASLDLSAGIPVLFRTYPAAANQTPNCAIWEAARATSAAPTIFKSIVVGGPGLRQPYIDGGVGHNNPVSQVLREAEWIFPGRRLACLVSIGTGQAETISIPARPTPLQRIVPIAVIKAMISIATDCEAAHQDILKRFRNNPNVYFRFNVEHGLQSVELAHWDQLDRVAAHTRHYLMTNEVDERVDVAIDIILNRPKNIPRR